MDSTVSGDPGSTLVADIGGTNARFARACGSPPCLIDVENLACADYPGVLEAVSAYRDLHPEPVQAACFAVAGPVREGRADLPNSHWSFDAAQLQSALGLPVSLINDFTAQVLSVAALPPHELIWLGEARADHGTVAVVGPGTGLGVAARFDNGQVLPSEAGHIAWGPTSPHQTALLDSLWQRYRRVSVERVLSGQGLSNLYWANARLAGSASELSPAGVTAGAQQGDALCLAAISDFLDVLADFAGDFALTTDARGGLYLSGGVLPRLLGFLDPSRFRQRFENKGRFSDFMGTVPLAVVTSANPGLVGCAAYIAEA